MNQPVVVVFFFPSKEKGYLFKTLSKAVKTP